MPDYRVKWKIDIEAGSLIEAAQKAREIQLDPMSTATVFEVAEQIKIEGFTLNIQRRIIDLTRREE